MILFNVFFVISFILFLPVCLYIYMNRKMRVKKRILQISPSDQLKQKESKFDSQKKQFDLSIYERTQPDVTFRLTFEF